MGRYTWRVYVIIDLKDSGNGDDRVDIVERLQTKLVNQGSTGARGKISLLVSVQTGSWSSPSLVRQLVRTEFEPHV
jgi:hypothetical protein